VEWDVAFTPSVLFEFGDIVGAEAFALAIGACAVESRLRSANGWLVAVQLSPEPSDLALVLRRAEAWLRATGRGGILFHLDGRAYLLQADPPEPVAAASTAGASWDS
jgi:hypothetical protein